MANESVSFDFTSRGADGLARDFRSTADGAVAAAKGARILADDLERQRRAAATSAGATLALAKADKILADAEDEAIAKYAEERVAADKAAEAKRRDAEAAKRDAEETKKATESHKRLSSVLKGLGGLGAGGGLFAAGAAGVAAASPLAGLTAAIGAFGAVAGPELAKVNEALQKTGKARKTAFAALTPAEKGLAGDVEKLKDSFHHLESSMAPLIGSVVKVATAFLTNVMPAFKILANVGGHALETILGYLGQFVRSPFFKQIATQLGQLASQVAPLLGQQLVALLKVFLQLFVQAGPAGLKLLRALLPAIVELVTDLTPAIVAVANITAAFVQFLAQKHLLIPFLGALALAFLAVSAGGGPIFATVAAIAALVGAIIYLVKHWGQVWGSIKSIAADAWHFIHDGWGKYLLGGIYLLVNLIIFLRNHWNTAWHDIRAITATIVDKIIGYFGLIVHAGATLLGWVPGIGPKLKQAAAAFDRFRNDVNGAIRGVQNRTVDVGVNFSLGVPGHRLAAAGGYITGPGTPTSDSIPAMLSNGEYVVKAAAVAKYGTAMMDTINAQRFAGGGQVGVHPSLPSPGQIQSNIGPTLHSLAVQFAKTAITAIGPPAGHGSYGGGVSRWAPLVLQVLRMLGQPAGDLGTVLSQMQTESGGNPFAINLSDSNAAAGDPSRGLMQVIGSTFAAYAGPFRGRGIYDPLANIYAGLNYAIHRYGSGWTSVLGHGHGYDSGGWLPTGLSLAYNGTGRPERVLSPRQSAGGNHYTINVTVAPMANPRDAGRSIVEAIKMYEKGSGSGWRR